MTVLRQVQEGSTTVENFDWSNFLQQYNAELLPSEQVAEAVRYLDDDGDLAAAVQAGWLGYPGASDEQLARTEERLGLILPPSYRAFLTVSNGWRYPSIHIPRLWSTEELEWFNEPETIESWSDSESVSDADYFVYGDEQQPSLFRVEYLKHALQIGEREIAGTAVYLLIPDVVTPEGEWEAWMFAHWLPGARRYRSFRELMEDERRTFLQSEARVAGRMRPADTAEQLLSKLPNLIDELLKQAELFRQIERERPGGYPGAEAGTAGATAAGLEEVADSVRRLQAQKLDPEALLTSLRALQQETTQKHLDASHRRGKPSLFSLLNMQQTIQEMAQAEGYRQAAARIEWFLGGTRS